MCDSKEISSLSEYIEYIERLPLPICKSDPFLNMKYYFRGQSNQNYRICPSIDREANKSSMNNWQILERALINSALEKLPNLFGMDDYPARLLAKLQHYGIPTRMMDLTKSPLVALYFACGQKCKDEVNPKDGKVVIMKGSAASVFDPWVNAIADTYFLTGNAWISFENYYNRVLHRPYAVNLIYSGRDNDEEKAALIKNFIKKVSIPHIVETGNLCERQIKQQGCFMIFPNDILAKDDDSDEMTLTDQMVKFDSEMSSEEESDNNDQPAIVAELIIPSSAKKNILESLEKCGIREEFLFSDDANKVIYSIVENQRERLGLPVAENEENLQ